MSTDPKPRPLDHLWTTAQVVGVVVTLTGFTPDRWVTYFLDAVRLPDSLRDSLLSGVDLRVIAVGVGVVIIAADAIYRNRKRGQQQISAVSVGTTGTAAQLTAASPLMDNHESVQGKPSIAVLPFVNMSDDKSQEYFADGMTEDIITGLSCDSRLFVIARNSTFVYKGKPVDIRAVGKELGVRYVLEGSIRPIGDRLRITLQLIETASGAHVWADKIDRPVAELFTVMDEVVDGLVTTLCSSLGVAEGKRAARQRPEDLQAWALCVQAEVLYYAQPSVESLREAAKLAQRAAEIEPGYAVSWAFLSYAASLQIAWGLSSDLRSDSEASLALIDKALSLAPNDPTVLGYCGYAAIWAGQAPQAINYLERSLAINPNNSFARFAYGSALYCDARPGEGIAQLQLFIRRAPKDPYIGLAYFFLSFCYLQLGEFQQAEQAALNAVKHLPGFGWAYAGLAMSLAVLGRASEAQQQIQKVRQLAPSLTLPAVEGFWRHVLRKPGQAEKFITLTRQAWQD